MFRGWHLEEYASFVFAVIALICAIVMITAILLHVGG
jgi:hypothetical protein